MTITEGIVRAWGMCVVWQTRTERDAKRMHELESRIQAENARNRTLSDELATLKV